MEDLRIINLLLVSGFKKAGQAGDEGVSIKRSSTPRSIKEDQVLKIDSTGEGVEWVIDN